MVEKYRDWFQKNEKTFYDFYFNYLKFPTVSGKKEHKKDLLACSQWLVEKLKGMGLDVQVWETCSNPVIYAERIVDPSLPTVLLYNHYDVQPVEPVELWTSDPFKPEEREGRFYARGASDNKGQGAYTIAAVEAFLACGDKDRINLKMCIEGDEETGSVGLTEITSLKKRELAADYLLIVDVEVPALDHPVVTLGIRGITTLSVEVKAASHDLHSGAFGGLVMNPAKALTRALATLWDDEGKICVEGFFDGIVPLSSEEREALDKSYDYDAMIKSVVGAPEKGELWEANWIEPTLEINGFGSGYYGEHVKTIIPAKARVMLSARLVPGQDPAKVQLAIADHLKKEIDPALEVSIELGHSGFALRTSPKAKIAKKCQRAYEEVTKRSCGLALAGATIPVALELEEASGAEVVGVGYGLTKDEIHAPNESFGRDQIELGFLTMATMLDEIAKE